MIDGQFLDPVVIAPARAIIARAEAPIRRAARCR